MQLARAKVANRTLSTKYQGSVAIVFAPPPIVATSIPLAEVTSRGFKRLEPFYLPFTILSLLVARH